MLGGTLCGICHVVGWYIVWCLMWLSGTLCGVS